MRRRLAVHTLKAAKRRGRYRCGQHRSLGSKVSGNVPDFFELPPSRMRNICILAHVDHGKTALSEKMLEITNGSLDGFLDSLRVERERGITVKAATASMMFTSDALGEPVLLNLIDTPGHVDFSFEVLRSLHACQGGLLLLDSTQGIQAQTLANYRSAVDAGLKIIPCLTKLDLPHSDPATAILQLESAFGFEEEEVLWTSAKTGEGVDVLLQEVVRRIPSPGGDPSAPFSARIVDSWYNPYVGVISLINMIDGEVCKGDSLVVGSTGKRFDVQETGVLLPKATKTPKLVCGQVGYMICGMKSIGEAIIGDTLSCPSVPLSALDTGVGASKPKSLLFCSMYPVDSGEFDSLRKALDKLLLNDSSVTVEVEASEALGQGFRCGFLGRLHMEVFHQRLSDEYDTEVIMTAPRVPYEAIDRKTGDTIHVERAADLPSKNDVTLFLEPCASVVIVTPPDHMGALMTLLQKRRGIQVALQHLDESRVVLQYTVPWQEVVADLYDDVKSISSGFASFEYEDAEAREADLVKVDMLINGREVDALSFITIRSKAENEGRRVGKLLKSEIKRQQFEVVVQARVGSKIITRERIPPFRKNVLLKSGKTVGGGDKSRKQKLLAKQKRGKSRMKVVGNVEISQKAFLSVLKR